MKVCLREEAQEPIHLYLRTITGGKKSLLFSFFFYFFFFNTFYGILLLESPFPKDIFSFLVKKILVSFSTDKI